MNLTGKQLAAQVPDSTTGNQARTMFGDMAAAAQGAYATLASYDAGDFAGLDFGSVQAAREYLDSTETMIQGYYSQMPADDNPLAALQLQQLKTSVSGCSVAVQTIDDLFSTSWAADLADSIVTAAGTVSSAIANTVAKVAGSFLGGMWWLIAIGIGGYLLYLRIKKGKT